MEVEKDKISKFQKRRGDKGLDLRGKPELKIQRSG